MPNRFISVLRVMAASLLCLSGLAHIAALWHRELSGMAVVDALVGSVYLIIALGLFGQSRFSLFMAIITPVAATAVLLQTLQQPGPVHIVRIGIDLTVALLSAVVLWAVRKEPSV